MGAAVRSELTKLTSTRLWWVLALAMFGYLAFIGAVMAFSLIVSYAIVFASEFDQPQPPGIFQHPLTETTLAYAVSLIVSFLVLWMFDQIEGGDPLRTMFERTIVLAVPTTVGGAAGRLVV